MQEQKELDEAADEQPIPVSAKTSPVQSAAAQQAATTSQASSAPTQASPPQEETEDNVCDALNWSEGADGDSVAPDADEVPSPRSPRPPKLEKRSVQVASTDQVQILTQVAKVAPSPEQAAARIGKSSPTAARSPGGTEQKPLLPMQAFAEPKRVLVLDLDETLVHAEREEPPSYDFDINVKIARRTYRIFVSKRPGLEEFLQKASQHYELVIFTASMAEYGKAVLKVIDPNGYVSHFLGRDQCTNHDGEYVKDLARLGRPLRDIILLDDNPRAFLFQPENALPINSWYDEQDDEDLAEVLDLLDIITKSDRSAVTTLSELDTWLKWNRSDLLNCLEIEPILLSPRRKRTQKA